MTYAQQSDSVTTRISYIPTGIRIGTDLISLIRTPLSDRVEGWEVNADIDFHRYFLTVDYGKEKTAYTSSKQDYTSSGSYFRIGVDAGLFGKGFDKNMFFLGLRYAFSNFDEQFSYTVEDAVFRTINKTLTNTSVTANWAEAVLGMRLKIWKGLWMGYTIRLKVMPNINSSGALETYNVPGFGLVSKDSYWGFNYQLFWRVGFRRR